MVWTVTEPATRLDDTLLSTRFLHVTVAICCSSMTTWMTTRDPWAPSPGMAQRIVVVDGSAWRADGGGRVTEDSWAVAAAIVDQHGSRRGAAVTSSRRGEYKECSVVELLAILAGTRLARAYAKLHPDEMPINNVVLDRPSVFSNLLAALNPGHGKPARRPELARGIEVLLNDYARSTIRRRQAGQLVLLSRQEAVRRGLMRPSELVHAWTPHELIEAHFFGQQSFHGDNLSNLETDTTTLLTEVPRAQCNWTCSTDRHSVLVLTCRPFFLPPPPPTQPPPIPVTPLVPGTGTQAPTSAAGRIGHAVQDGYAAPVEAARRSQQGTRGQPQVRAAEPDTLDRSSDSGISIATSELERCPWLEAADPQGSTLEVRAVAASDRLIARRQ